MRRKIILGTVCYMSQAMSALGNTQEPHFFDLGISDLINIKVVTGTKYEQRLSEVPAHIEVITQQQIQERGYRNLLDLLTHLPGVDVQKNNATTWHSTITVRGILGNNKFIILQDGIRINAPTGEVTTILDNFPLHHVKRVEVLFGPASALYGPDAVSGVINLITNRDEGYEGFEVSVGTGNENDAQVYLHGGTKLSENLSLVLGGHYQESDNVDLSKRYEEREIGDLLDFSGVHTSAADRGPFENDTQSYSAFTHLNFRQSFKTGVHYTFQRHRSDTGYLPARTNYDADSSLHNSNLSLYGQYTESISDKLEFELTLDYLVYTMHPDSKFNNIFSGPYENGYKYAEGERLHTELQLNYALDDTSKLVLGVVYEDLASIPKTVDLVDQFDTDETFDQGFYRNTDNELPVRIFNVQYHSIGTYLQYQKNWQDTFYLTLGARYDSTSNYEGRVNPRAGFVFKPNKDTAIKLHYGEAYLQPSAWLAYEHFGSFDGTKTGTLHNGSFFNVANEDLEPEVMRSGEVSLYHNITEKLSVNLGFYVNQLDDMIFAGIPTDPVVSDFIPGGLLTNTSSAQNIGDALIYGSDLTIKNRFEMGVWNFDNYLSYSYVDGEISRDDKNFDADPAYAAPHKVKAGTTIKWGDKFDITPQIRWLERTYTRTSSNTANKSVDGFFVIDLHANYHATQQLNAYLTINNLLDKEYYNAPGVSAFTTGLRAPQETFRFWLGLKYKM